MQEKRLAYRYNNPVPVPRFTIRLNRGVWRDVLGNRWERDSSTPHLVWTETTTGLQAEEVNEIVIPWQSVG